MTVQGGSFAYLCGVQHGEGVFKPDSESSKPEQANRPCDAKHRQQDNKAPHNAPKGAEDK